VASCRQDFNPRTTGLLAINRKFFIAFRVLRVPDSVCVGIAQRGGLKLETAPPPPEQQVGGTLLTDETLGSRSRRTRPNGRR